MDKLFVRKDVYEELLEKGFGKKDYSKLTKKKITDKNGHTRTVFVRNGEQPAAQKQPKAQEGLSDEKRAKYEEMLEQVKAGPEENALFVRGKGMLSKKDAIAHLSEKLGTKTVNSAAQKPGIPIQGSNWISLPSGTRVTNEGAKEKMAKNNERIETLKKLMEGNTKADNFRLNSELRSLQNENEYIASRLPPDREEKKPVRSSAQGHLEADEPLNTDITAEDEKRFGKEALSGLSGKRTGSDAKNKMTDEEKFEVAVEKEGADIGENNKINTLSEKIEFTPEEMKVIKNVAEKINYQPGDEGYLLNTIYSENKDVYSDLTKKNKEAWDKSGKKQKTFSSTDLLKEKIKSLNGKFEVEENETSAKTFEEAKKNYNLDKEKKEYFAMDEISKFYPDLKELADKRYKAHLQVGEAERKVKSNPNNDEYKENFRNAVNELNKVKKECQDKTEKALKKAPDISKPSVDKYVDAIDTVKKLQDKYKTQLETYEVAERLRANGGASILSPMWGRKPDDITMDPDFINAQLTIRAFEGK